MTDHQQILDMLNQRWIDMGGGRQKLAKRNLPPIAYDQSPCFFVRALPSDRMLEDVGVQFGMLMHEHRHFNFSEIFHTLAWHVIVPGRKTYFICHWAHWGKHTVPLFQEFCRKAGREFGTLTPDRMIDLGTRQVSFFDCKVIHDRDIRPKQVTVKKTSEAARDVRAAARKLLRSRKPSQEELELEVFRNDQAAHDRELLERLRRKFAKRVKSIQKELTEELGPPAETGTGRHKDIPLGAVIQYAIWNIKGKRVYVAAHHEDIGLPFALILGRI
jgi:hypothetical protein